MRVEFLVRGKKAKAAFEDVALPEGVTRKPGTYKAKGGELYFFTFGAEGNTLDAAERLARVRDSLPSDQNVKLLEDGASAKFGENLYPLFSDFERGLREAFVIATCAVKGNFDASFVKDVESNELSKLEKKLFLDHEFRDKVAAIGTDNLLSKDDIVEQVAALVENTPWDALFDEGDMPSLRTNFREIRDRRNDVMHFHRMRLETFRSTKSLLKKVNAEIDACIERMHTDVDYPKKRAENAREAVRIIDANEAAGSVSVRSLAEAMNAMTERYASLSGVTGLNAAIAEMANVNGLSTSITGAVDIGGVNKVLTDAVNTGAIAMLSSNSASLEAANKVLDEQRTMYSGILSSMPMLKMNHVFDLMEEPSALQETRSKLLESMEPSLKQIQAASASLIEMTNSSFVAGMNYGALFGAVENDGLDDPADNDDSGLDQPDSSLSDDSDASEE